jgi:hypothetical protein
MSERVDSRRAKRDITLNVVAARPDCQLISNLGSTTGAHISGEASPRAFDASLATSLPAVRGATLEAAAKPSGFSVSDQANVQVARRGARQGNGDPMSAPSMLKLGPIRDAAPVGVSETSPWERKLETSDFAEQPSTAPLGGVYHAALFSAAAVIEPVSATTPAASYSHLNFSSGPSAGPLPSIGSPIVDGAGLIKRLR